MQPVQQMQVTVPAGVGPGMPFMVDTPSGQVQVTCPPGAMAGGQMLVNVPAAQPVMMVQAVPDQIVMGVAMDAPMAQPVAAPNAQEMGRGKMDGSLSELESGCYMIPAPCCCLAYYLTVDVQNEQVNQGPCCFLLVCCCPCSTGQVYKAVAAGSSEFKRPDGEYLAWQTRNTLNKRYPSMEAEEQKMVKWC